MKIMLRADCACLGAVAWILASWVPAAAQSSQTSFPNPPGVVVTGPVFRSNGTSLPIATGADANAYIFSTPPTAAFLAGAPADVVRTTAPTQYVRVYTQNVTFPNRAFIAGSNTIRGLTAAQIKDVLALPYLPTSITIVQVPAGTCVLTGTGAPVNGTFAANPPAIVVGGPWGNGGTYQSYLVGTSSTGNCANPQFLPSADYINRQLLGTYALAYTPNAGTGNAAAVAVALDHATPPALFTDMDGVYNDLDLLNYGNPYPLRQALAQLDGEVYADTATVAITAGQLFLGVLRDQMHSTAQAIGQPVPWLAAVGGGGSQSGNGDSHNAHLGAGGITGGVDEWITPALRVGVAVGYTRATFSTDGISGSGGANSASVAPYVRYAPGAWYVEGSAGYAYDGSDVTRGIHFPGVARTATSHPSGNGFVSRVETGYRLDAGPATAITPYAAFQSIVYAQDSFTESGAGALNLAVASHTTASARSELGGEITRSIPVGLSAPLRLTGRLGWAYEFAGTRRDSTAALTGTPGAAFTIDGAPAPRNLAVFGAGAGVKVGSGEMFLRYAGQAGAGSLIQGGTLGARWAF